MFSLDHKKKMPTIGKAGRGSSGNFSVPAFTSYFQQGTVSTGSTVLMLNNKPLLCEFSEVTYRDAKSVKTYTSVNMSRYDQVRDRSFFVVESNCDPPN